MPEPRSITSTLVGWCPDCLYHIPYEGPGMGCMMECGRKLVKRRFWVCSVCTGGYNTKGDAEKHECYGWQ